MIANLMALSVRARWAIIFIIAIISAFGVWQLSKLPIDAVTKRRMVMMVTCYSLGVTVEMPLIP